MADLSTYVQRKTNFSQEEFKVPPQCEVTKKNYKNDEQDVILKSVSCG